jgi:hypothetical protein
MSALGIVRAVVPARNTVEDSFAHRERFKAVLGLIA